jgi:hypothetical protein
MTKTELLSVIETNITNASLPSSITPSVRTSVLNALANYDPCPYKIYSALISQSDTNAPVATVLENTLGEEVTFSYVESGNYMITNVDLFVEGKTSIFLGREGFAGTLAPVIGYNLNFAEGGFYNSVQLTSSHQGSSLTTLDNLINNISIEIRVYN